MTGKTILLAAVAVLAVGAGIGLQRQLSSGQKQRYPSEFVDVIPDIKRLGYTWVNYGGLLPVDVLVYLMKHGSDYILMDVGAPGENDRLVNAVNRATKDGKLRLVILTHGHTDHCAALPALLKAHPGVQVLMHAVEAPYVTGTADYSDVQADNFGYKLTRLVFEHVNVSSALHPGNTLLLQGERGDIADARGPSGALPMWAPAKGFLSFVWTPGHAKGHVSYVHEPSKSLLTGDVMAHLGDPPVLLFPPSAFSWNNTQIREDARKLAELDVVRVFPSHDHGMGVSHSELRSFVAAL